MKGTRSSGMKSSRWGRRASWVLLVGLAPMISNCSNGQERFAGVPVVTRQRTAVLRIGTYNLYVRAHDLPQTIAVIKRMDADVIALQEVRPDNARSLSSALATEYPYRYFSSGLGMLSRFPLRHPHFQRSQRGSNGFILP